MDPIALPGSIPVKGRRFLYLQAADTADFLRAFRSIGDLIEAREPQFPAGGMLSENFQVTTPDGRSFFGLSFKGDLDRWGSGIEAFAGEAGRALAAVENEQFRVDDGAVFALRDCRVESHSRLG